MSENTPRRIIRFRTLCQKLDSPAGTVKHWIHVGTLPKPHVKLGPRCSGWWEDEIDRILETWARDAA